ncbi:DUF3253 domain-containing protein [Algoriphagus confluentis]|uniref:DUF3253 domain-containing protein n=1 Tax=Algoriphagus confluentis TaxID=1697556 RepID=UPI0030C65E2A
MDILKSAILDFCRRRKTSSFCPSEVVRSMYPEDWRLFMPDIRQAMLELYREGHIVVTQRGIPVSLHEPPQGPVRISKVQKPK